MDAARAGLLRAIIANPADDTPRLILADYLEDHGDSDRAEFIRVQCALALGEGCSSDWCEGGEPDGEGRSREHTCGWGERLRRRERDLLFDHWPRWSRQSIPFDGPLTATGDNCHRLHLDPDRTRRIEFVFRRGFVAAVRLRVEDFLAHGPALVRAAPLEEVRLEGKEPSDNQNMGWWRWWGERTDYRRVAPEPDDLPTALWLLLEGDDGREAGYVRFGTRALALKALSQACLSWACAQGAAQPCSGGDP